VTGEKMTPTQAQANVRKMLAAVVNDGAVYEIRQPEGPVAVVMPFDEYDHMRREIAVLSEAERGLDA
jgi:PHD/YefM family antitoxin component YafN of YafNO toxin-antitoxin module